METKKVKSKSIGEINIAKAVTMMFKDIESGRTIYLAFSKRGFHLLIFALAIGTAANIALIDILLQGTGFITMAHPAIVTLQLILSGASVITGVWLFFKGINMIVE